MVKRPMEGKSLHAESGALKTRQRYIAIIALVCAAKIH